jgi:hypothetical protein
MTPATNISNEDSNSMFAHYSRNVSNNKNESNNRMANIVGTPAKRGFLQK